MELKHVAYDLNDIKSSLGAKLGEETSRLLRTIASKKTNPAISLKIDNLEKLSNELHGLEVKYGISLGQSIYYFLHAFHKN